MRILVSQPMGKKGEFIRIRADAHLRQAVESLTPTGGHPGQKLANSPSTKPKKPRK